MAKRTNTTSNSNYSTVKICAFWGLILAGIAGLINFVLTIIHKAFNKNWRWASKVSGACSFISQIALFVGAWLAAWDFVKYKTKGWRVVYWVFLILGILGLVGLGLSSWL